MVFYQAVVDSDGMFEGLIYGRTKEELLEKAKSIKLKKYGKIFRTSNQHEQNKVIEVFDAPPKTYKRRSNPIVW